MKSGHVLAIAAAGWLVAGSTAFAEVQLTMQNGQVSIVAKDATLRQILAEWARVGQTKMVNVERVPGGPMTLELRNVPEDQALDVLMRSLSGYVAAPRAAQAANLSRFDRIVIMPTMAAARQPATTTAPPPPVFQQPQVLQPAPADDDTGDERAGANMPGQNPGAQRGPIFSAFPQPQVVNPNAAPVNAQQPGYIPPPGMAMPGAPGAQPPANTPMGFPTAPAGVAVPGMIVPGPPQPGSSAAPAVPARRTGGPGGA